MFWWTLAVCIHARILATKELILMSSGAENSIASSSRLSPESQGLIRRQFRFLTRVCALDKRSECLAEYCVLFFVLALTIWAGMLWGVLIGRGALSAGLVPGIEPTPVEARSAGSAHTEWHSEIHDLVKLWGFSRETVRQMVKDDPGVVKIRFGRKKSHTRYRIPESAAKRIHSRAKPKSLYPGFPMSGKLVSAISAKTSRWPNPITSICVRSEEHTSELQSLR